MYKQKYVFILFLCTTINPFDKQKGPFLGIAHLPYKKLFQDNLGHNIWQKIEVKKY